MDNGASQCYQCGMRVAIEMQTILMSVNKKRRTLSGSFRLWVERNVNERIEVSESEIEPEDAFHDANATSSRALRRVKGAIGLTRVGCGHSHFGTTFRALAAAVGDLHITLNTGSSWKRGIADAMAGMGGWCCLRMVIYLPGCRRIREDCIDGCRHRVRRAGASARVRRNGP